MWSNYTLCSDILAVVHEMFMDMNQPVITTSANSLSKKDVQCILHTVQQRMTFHINNNVPVAVDNVSVSLTCAKTPILMPVFDLKCDFRGGSPHRVLTLQAF